MPTEYQQGDAYLAVIDYVNLVVDVVVAIGVLEVTEGAGGH